nr:BF3164 family lipoprotein [uncultured Bacteroides sp.]
MYTMPHFIDSEKLFLSFIFIAGFLVGCTASPIITDSPLKDFSNKKTEKINVSKSLVLEQYEIYKPCSVIKDGGCYLVENQTNENLINIIDIRKNKVIHGINIGEGPNELISPSSFQRRGNDFFIYDIARKTVYKICKGEDSISINKFNQIITNERLLQVYLLPKGFFGLGLMGDSWVTYYNNLLTSSLDFPDFNNTRNFTNIEKGSLYMSSTITVKPDGAKMVCAAQNAGVISFCNLQSEKMLEYKRLKYHEPLVSPPRTAGSSSIAFDRNNKIAFCSSASDNNYVFLLYSGRTFNSHGMSSHHCEHVLIYDWAGKPLKHLILEKPIYGNLNYDSGTHTLYGIGYDPEGVILEYDLSRIEL